MRYHVLATDYDGTLASGGRVDEATIAALERARASGRKLVLVTGRQLEDLLQTFARCDLFDAVVVENGAVLYWPARREVEVLAEPPPPRLIELLRARGVQPLDVGRVIAATWTPHDTAVLAAIRELGLELQLIFNKGAVMVLPSGVNKATGLARALERLGFSPHNAIGVGDAENDHAFLGICECAVAVANALPALAESADWVLSGERGDGVRELVDALLRSDLQELDPRLERHQLALGEVSGGSQQAYKLAFSPYAGPLLIAGTSGGGKSTLATALLEQLAARGYQFCIVDPEGDYRELDSAVALGDGTHAPAVEEVMELLEHPGQNAVVNLLGVPLADRSAYFASLLPALLELRARSGRPHWILIDEAHHLLPADRDGSAVPWPRAAHGFLLITVHPGSLGRPVLDTLERAVAIGSAPRETLSELARALGLPPPEVNDAPLAAGHGVLWLPHSPQPPEHFRAREPDGERRRHRRKYASGELGPDKSFYFRGPGEKLNLRAQNLQLFAQIARGVDDATWLHHLQRGDYSRWFRESIKDEALAAASEAIEKDAELRAPESREGILGAIEERYTAPAS